MAKKSQTNARRNNTQAGRRVVNFYNNGTVNIDARQNRSRTNKTENNGCTINYPYNPSSNMEGDYSQSNDDQIKYEPHTEVQIDHSSTSRVNKISGNLTFKKIIMVAMGTLAVGLTVSAIKNFKLR